MAKKKSGSKFVGAGQPTGYAQVSAPVEGKKKGNPGVATKNKC